MTKVTQQYTPSLNVSISEKSGVTLWTTGVSNSTVRFGIGSALPAVVVPTGKVSRNALNRAAKRLTRPVSLVKA